MPFIPRRVETSRGESLEACAGLLYPAEENGPSDQDTDARIGFTSPVKKEMADLDKNDKVLAKSAKMNTFSGVFIPTTLNVLSILMFLRFGFILGQVGLIAMLGMLFLSYLVDLLTTLSVSAISTNGTVRGGGAYYMISRSLGPEFGGSIGIVFYIGQLLNSAMNVVGFCEPLIANFGKEHGIVSQWLPEGRWWEFLYATTLLLICIAVCLSGPSLFAKAGNFLFVILILSTISVPLSAIFVRPFYVPKFDIFYTGMSWSTLRSNLLPRFSQNAAGAEGMKLTFQSVFGIFFPATAGIFAGVSMSGDLADPSASIPSGTIYGLLVTLLCYFFVIVSMAGSIPRLLLYRDIQVMQTINLHPIIIMAGELSTSLFSSIVGIVGCAKLLQAIAHDSLLPMLNFLKHGSKRTDNPIPAILVTYIIAQLMLLTDINQIASLITMAFLLTFIVTNLACFLLRVASAPNFRPSFKYFDASTSGGGALLSLVTMYVVDTNYATAMIFVMCLMFLLIHMTAPPKSWGDVSQTLIYHQVRKYLLRLREDHVKFWRPQILLFVDDPRSCWNLMLFCNSLKKGSLYVVDHVVADETFETEDFVEISDLKSAYRKIRDQTKIKAFIQISLAPSTVWGVRNAALSAGLGGMRPNIAVLGFFETHNWVAKPQQQPEGNNEAAINIEMLPTDACRQEKPLKVTEWVQIIEDLLLLRMNVAIARGFPRLELPPKVSFFFKQRLPRSERKNIDLWPIQMSGAVHEAGRNTNLLTTNFDTYTLILQLGAILHTVRDWRYAYTLRVMVFVECPEDEAEEKKRVQRLLSDLRIDAAVHVIALRSGRIPSYEIIVNGKPDPDGHITDLLGEDPKTYLENIAAAAREVEEEQSHQQQELMTEQPPSAIQISPGAAAGVERRNVRYLSLAQQMPRMSFSVQTSNLMQRALNEIHNSGQRRRRLRGKQKSQDKNSISSDYSSSSSSSTGCSSSVSSNVSINNDNDSEQRRARQLRRLERRPRRMTILALTENDKANLKQSLNDLPGVPRRSRAKSVVVRGDDKHLTGAAPIDPQTQRVGQRSHGTRPRANSTNSYARDFDVFSQHPSQVDLKNNAKGQQKQTGIFGTLKSMLQKSEGQNDTKGDSGSVFKKRYTPAAEDEEACVDEDDVEVPPEQTKREERRPPSPAPPTPPIATKPHTAFPLSRQISRSSSSAALRQQRLPKFSSQGLCGTKVVSDDEEGSNTAIRFEPAPDERPHSVRSTRAGTTRSGNTSIFSDSYMPRNYGAIGSDETSTSASSVKDNHNNHNNDNTPLVESEEEGETSWDFNSLPARLQHIILNDVMKAASKGAAVVFTTLPAPFHGTHRSHEDSLAYVEDLKVLCDGLPPVLLINSQTVTVTMAL